MDLLRYFKKDVQEYVIIKDTTLENGDLLRRGSTFIIDFIKNKKVCIHFPENTPNKMNKYKEEFVTIDKLFEIAMRYEDDQDLHEQIENLLDINTKLADRVDELEENIEVHERIGEDIAVKDQLKDYYNERLLQSTLEKTTEEKNIYKKTINKMCDKFGIDHSEVFKIIDNIKGKNNEREM